eukprot:TRINITY_DN4838_c0_g1_i9.p1 TRINITY_DN4838_c0_g1~~TRINITY_DN4838_c0_g1_i9.p1  ORF type:complete len:131 (+),score=30.98 TRINITY_DN4838_c0_g1_i9:116-508(+)
MDRGQKRKFRPKENHQELVRKKILKNQEQQRQEKEKRKEEAILDSLQPVHLREPKLPRTFTEKQTAKRLIVILENVPLETVKSGRDFYLLNSDDHAHMLTKDKRDPAEMRPDSLHPVSYTHLTLPTICSV